MSSFIQGFMESDEMDKAGLRELNFDIEPENVGYYNSIGDVYKTGYGDIEERIYTSIGSTSDSAVVGGYTGGAVDMMNYGNMSIPGDIHGIGRGVDNHHCHGVDYALEYSLGYHQGAYGQVPYEEYGQEYGHYLIPSQQGQQQAPGVMREEYPDVDGDQELEYDEYDSGRRFSTQVMYSQNTEGTSSDLSDTVSETETKLSTPESFSATIKQYELYDLKLRSRRVLLVQQLELNYDHSMLANNHVVICTHCNNRFDSILQLGHHFDKNKLVTPHKCPFDSCPYFFIGFARKAELRRHCLTKHFEKGKLTQSINQNIKQVLNNLIYSCKIDNCGKNFYRKDSLQRHLKLVHENENSKFNKKMKKNQLQKLVLSCHRHAHVAQK
mmetsp:Transcript_195/g.174  ORF Transcript_195/g.174 Transcript_195/m.174 type:complete len:382 (-) Transcript_195:655-1800(-)